MGIQYWGTSSPTTFVLSAGEQLVRTVLPPIESHNQINALEIHVEFHSKGQKLERGTPRCCRRLANGSAGR